MAAKVLHLAASTPMCRREATCGLSISPELLFCFLEPERYRVRTEVSSRSNDSIAAQYI